MITPNDIARYLKLTRPSPKTITYPIKGMQIDLRVINEELYLNVAEADMPHVPSIN